jgi:WD40 repeat protein
MNWTCTATINVGAFVHTTRYTSDGIAIAYADCQGIGLIDVSAKESIFRIDASDSTHYRACAVSPNGQWLVAGKSNGGVTLFNISTEERVHTAVRQSMSFHGVNDCCFSPDGLWIAIASNYESLLLHEFASTTVMPTTIRLEALRERHSHKINACDFGPNGKLVVSASLDGTLRIWDVATRRCIAVLDSGTCDVSDCAFNPSGTRVAAAYDDKMLRLWDVANGTCVMKFVGHTSPVKACAFSPDGKTLLSASLDETLRLWDVQSGESTAVLKSGEMFKTTCAFDPNGRRIIAGDSSGTIILWDAF